MAGTHPYEKDERKAAVCHRINRLSTTQYRTEPSAVIAAVVLHNRMPSSDETGHAVKIQRMWRGVIARREFSDLFFAAVEEVLGPWLVPSGSDCDDDKAPKSSQRSSPSLEEAKLEAAYNPSANSLVHVSSSPSYHKRRTVVGAPSAAGVGGAALGGGSSCAASRGSSCAASPSLNRGNVAPAGFGSAAASPAVNRSSRATDHSWTPGGRNANGVATSSTAAAASTNAPQSRTANAGVPQALWARSQQQQQQQQTPPQSHRQHRRVPSEVSRNVTTATALAALEGMDGGDGHASSDLEFTEEMADSMSLDALRDLARVLTRVIGTRNKELITLQERRDELRHERDLRQNTVNSLIAQVDRSQFVKEERKKAAKGPRKSF